MAAPEIPSNADIAPARIVPHFATRTVRTTEDAEVMAFLLGLGPDVQSMAPGAPADERLPVELLPTLTRRSIEVFGRRVLGYGPPEGHPLTRKAAQAHFASLGVIVKESEDVFITSGSQGGLMRLPKQ